MNENNRSRTPVRLALPSKGELGQPTLDFMSECKLPVTRANERQYTATLPAVPGSEVVFQRAPDVVSKVNDGSVALGITGYDLVAEHLEDSEDLVTLMRDLGYGRCELVVAVPESWVGVSSLYDIADIAAERRSNGQQIRVATKYPNLTRDFLHQNGVSYFSLVSAEGALESAPNVGYADIIVDLTSTGATLRDNRLRRIHGGLILKAQACLIGNRRRLKQDPDALRMAKTLLEYFEAHMYARGQVSVSVIMPGGSAEQLAKRVLTRPELVGQTGPAISQVYPRFASLGAWFEVHLVVQEAILVELLEHLRQLGATNIAVRELTYLFDSESQAYQALMASLRRK